MPLLAVLLSWALPAAGQPSADPALATVETPAGAVELPDEDLEAPGEDLEAPGDATDGPTQVAAPPAEVAGATEQSGEPPAEPTEPSPDVVPEGLPGECPAPAARTIEDRLARSDEGDAAADLDLAACWRLLEQPYPEAVALARALSRGLDEAAAGAARERLDALGGAPVPDDDGAAGGDPAPASAALDAADDDSGLPAYILAGIAGAGLIAGTAFGLATLHESSRAERELAGDTLELEYGIATAVCLGVGLAAGIAAIVLWPEATTGPAPGPGDVGLGWEVRW